MNRQSVLDKTIAEAGWVLVRTRKHNVWRCPCGKHQFVNSSSVSHSGLVNALAKFKNIQRQCVEVPTQRAQ